MMTYLKKHKSLIYLLTAFLLQGFSLALDLDEPDLGQIVTVAMLIFMYVVGLAGLVLAGVIAYSGWKFSSSLGDPRAKEAAKQTLTYAIAGFFVVVFFFVIFRIFASYLGISNITTVGGMLSEIMSAITELTGIAVSGTD